jgi:hypothetical protein
LLGWSRVRLYRAKMMAEIPADLFDQLMAAGVLSSKAFANIGLSLQRGRNAVDIERCPHCDRVLRLRVKVGDVARDVIRSWLAKAEP